MIKQENPNFVSSFYAPNPMEVTYWIDLSTDANGNVIKSYTGNDWLPINYFTNTVQSVEIKKLKQEIADEVNRAKQAEQKLTNDLNDKANKSDVYTKGDLWYGVRFTGSSPDGVRTGNMQLHKDLPVQSLFKGCRLTSDGTIKYFNATDWDHYEDGSEVTNSIKDGNDMVELPEAYYTVVVHGDYDWEIRMSLYPLRGYTKFSKKYCSAYEAYEDGSTLYSIREQVPTVNTDRATFLARARNGRSNSYAIYTYEIHKFITWCYVVEYATLNSQKAVNTGLTEEGYHQGGLGNGITDGTNIKNGVDRWAFVPTGTTNSLGNSSGQVLYSYVNTDKEGTETQAREYANRYRGIENPFGHIWKNCCDIIVTGTDNKIYVTNDKEKFGTDKSSYKDSGLTILTTGDQMVKRITNNAAADLFCQEGGADHTTYFCDYYWTQATASDRTLLFGAAANDRSAAGLFNLTSGNVIGIAGANIGTRLVYIP